MILYGVDFTSRPDRQKAITIARGRIDDDHLYLEGIKLMTSFAEFDAFLRRSGPWLAAFDFPFGLPRELVETLDWPRDWPTLIRHMASHTREELRAIYKGFCDTRPVGNKFAHRATDLLARSSPSMKWVNPPVAWMLLEGAPRLLDAGVHLPGLHSGDTLRVALEGYPALAARAVIGNASYKSDDAAKQTKARRDARAAILDALLGGEHAFGVQLAALSHARYAELVEDGTADRLDALLCLVEAAWGWKRRAQNYGLPAQIAPVEGWILTVPSN